MKMINASEITEDMTVVGSDGQQVGVVDKVEGDNIKLTKRDSPDGQHHFVPVSAVESVEGTEVRLNMSASDAQAGSAGSGDAEVSVGNGM